MSSGYGKSVSACPLAPSYLLYFCTLLIMYSIRLSMRVTHLVLYFLLVLVIQRVFLLIWVSSHLNAHKLKHYVKIISLPRSCGFFYSPSSHRLHPNLWSFTYVSIVTSVVSSVDAEYNFCVFDRCLVSPLVLYSPPVPPPQQVVRGLGGGFCAGLALPAALPPLPPPPPPPLLQPCAAAARPRPPQTRPLPGCSGRPQGPAHQLQRPTEEEEETTVK